MKSNMPCPPTSMPVMKLDQATGLCGGIVVARRRNSPFWRSRFRLGRSSQRLSKNSGSIPSTPRTIMRLPAALASLWPQPIQNNGDAASTSAAVNAARVTVPSCGSLACREAEKGVSFHVARLFQPEQAERGGGEILNTRIDGVYLTVAKQDARN